MHIPTQPSFDEFVPRFMQQLFAPEDIAVLCGPIHPDYQSAEQVAKCAEKPDYVPWFNQPYPRDKAIDFVLGPLRGRANIHVRASAYNGGPGYQGRSFVHTRAIFVDVDYGETGHRVASPFTTLDEAAAYLLTLPLRPSVAWHTGHGLQACYLLNEPYIFPAGGSRDSGSWTRYQKAIKTLGQMTMADAVSSPERPFRMPLTVNEKWWFDPPLDPVQGQILWCDWERRYSFEEIEAACAGYGIEEHIARYKGDYEIAEAESTWEDADAEEETGDIPYDELPDELRSRIEDTESERSRRLLGVVGWMVRIGCNDQTIHAHLEEHGDAFREKYEERRGGYRSEIDRCIAKARNDRFVYGPHKAPPLKINNPPTPVALSECAELPAALREMLRRYGEITEADIANQILDAARFLEHQFSASVSGVLETPCGSGKSTWALCHIAVSAGTDARYVYVTETVEELYRAADVLDQLAHAAVGRIHGFNSAKCQELCGHKRNWWQCSPNSKRSVCQQCDARVRCAFYNRAAEEQKPILCMTHEGLIRAIEDGSALLDGANVIVDENLNRFNTYQVSLADLENLQLHAAGELHLETVFPHSVFAHSVALNSQGISQDVGSFAGRNYIFRNEERTASLRHVYDQLRSCLGTGIKAPNRLNTRPGELARARETLMDLMGVLRPSSSNDACYAFRESRGDNGIVYTLKRSRFGFDTPKRCRKGRHRESAVAQAGCVTEDRAVPKLGPPGVHAGGPFPLIPKEKTMQQLFEVVVGVDYAARDTGRRITMCVRESDPLSAALKAEQEADKTLDHPDVEYTHAMHVAAVPQRVAVAALPLAA